MRDGRLLGARNAWSLTVRVVRQAIDDRIAGLGAEMAFFALLSLVPLIVAVGAALGYIERLIGAAAVHEVQQAAVRALTVVVTGEVAVAFVRGLLQQQRGGLALGGAVVTLWLASRVFSATIRALDLAYRVTERRSLLAQRGLAIVFALASVVVVTLLLTMVVVGPLLGGGRALSEQMGLGRAFELAWSLGRWPVLLLVAVGFLAWVYRSGPNVRNTWRECLPGAALGVLAWLLVTTGLRLYLAAGGDPAGSVTSDDEVVAAAGQVVAALVAVILWIYLSSIAILLGGVLNAQLAAAPARMDAPGP